jgi:ATP-dependent Lon protease
MQILVDHLKEHLPKTFHQEQFNRARERLNEKYASRMKKQVERLAETARGLGFEFRYNQEGHFLFVPLIDGKPPESEEQLQQLSDEQKARIEANEKELATHASRTMEAQRDLHEQLREEIRATQKRFGAAVVRPLIETIREPYADHPRVQKYLERVGEHVLDHLTDFRDPSQKPGVEGPLGAVIPAQDSRPEFLEYQVNVIVDNRHASGAPVIVEDAPTYRNLFGNIERTVERGGRWASDFMHIKAGSILRASGGYLIFNLEDALTEPLVYKNLKRVLKTGQIQLEAYDPWPLFGTGGLRPEPIPIHTKVVVVGPPSIYYILRFYDDEFAAIFKVKADFGTEMPRGPKEQEDYARFVAMLADEEKLRPFSRDAVTEIIRFGARCTEHQKRLYTRFSEIADLLRESDFFAARANSPTVQQGHVRQAIDSRVYRGGRFAEKIRELIREGTFLIDTRNRRTGQVNGLAVIDLGDYAFGRPARVTVSLGVGNEGVINIERESRLSGSTHDKGILILSGYLRSRYGWNKPLALSASICFEQSYSGIDGDSASSTELYALLSAVARVPLRQDIAVTGSINQWGEVQAIGGINEKVEGFFDVCRETGLSGTQGVCLPASNVSNLVLRDDVLQAISQGQFHLYPVQTVDEGIELLTGIRAGSPAEAGTFHGLVDRNLQAMAESLRNFSQARTTAVITDRADRPADHPPKLPGENP